jgi:hypothetical protein
MCRDFDYCGPLVSQAVKMLKGIRKARAALDAAMVPPFSLAKLRKALEACGRVGYIQAGTRYAEAVELKSKVERVEVDLEEAKISWDQAKLEAVLVLCDERIYAGHQFRGPLEEACREALVKVSPSSLSAFPANAVAHVVVCLIVSLSLSQCQVIFMNEVFNSAHKFCIEAEVSANPLSARFLTAPFSCFVSLES